MISNFKELNELFKEIDESINEKIHFYIIGGAVMLYHGLKNATKDIDIIVDSPKEFEEIEKTLKKLNFKAQILTTEYQKFDLNQIYNKEDYRIDLFQRSVCKGFILSKNMKKRAETIIKLNNLTISLCSTTDIFMFKTFTERSGDIEDCINLAQKDIDWTAMLQEIKEQINTSGKSIWITYIGERFDLLEEKNLTIPIMKEINKLREKYFKELKKQS